MTVDDCAAVSRHLTRVLAVEGIDYERLEVSSPGLDRPLRKAGGFRALCGAEGRHPDAHRRTRAGRRRFVGVLRGADAGQVSLELEGSMVALALDDVDRAKLVPEL